MTEDRDRETNSSPKPWWLFSFTLVLILLTWILVDTEFESASKTLGSWLRVEFDSDIQAPVRAVLLHAADRINETTVCSHRRRTSASRTLDCAAKAVRLSNIYPTIGDRRIANCKKVAASSRAT